MQRVPGTSTKENKNIYGAEEVAETGEIYCGVEMGWSQMGKKVETQGLVR